MDRIEVSYDNEDCGCTKDCDCRPGLVVKVNGIGGCGMGTWVLDPKTNKECYSCNMLGYEFDVPCLNKAVDYLKQRYRMFKHVEVVRG